MDDFFKIRNYVFPKGIKETAPDHAFRHAQNAFKAAAHCKERRYCVQAGGNVGLWPVAFAAEFQHVFTFEPDPISFHCLKLNISESKNIAAYKALLGDCYNEGVFGIKRESLGSHYMVDAHEGDAHCEVQMSIDQMARDSMSFSNDPFNVDLIQLDIEGFEYYALMGALETIRRCRPVICVELRDFPGRYFVGPKEVRSLLSEEGYIEVEALSGNDFIFKHKEAV